MTAAAKKGGAFFPTLFFMIGLLFCGILIYAYRITCRINPVMLDEKGNVQGAAKP